jgi:twitching motility protein PilI
MITITDTAHDTLTEVLCYTLGEQPVVSEISNILALQQCPTAITSVPGTQPWVLGLAVIEGDLLPIIDLPLFLGLPACNGSSLAYVLVVNLVEVHCGLLVTDVEGKSIMSAASSMTAEVISPVKTYVTTALHQNDVILPVFSLSALLADQRFSMGCLNHPALSVSLSAIRQ